MTVKRKDTAPRSKPIGNNLTKIDAYVLTQKDYDEVPELTEAWFARADLYANGKLVRRGRPKAAVTKDAVSLRLDHDVIAHFRKSGRGWQSRINDTLRKAARLPAKRSKA